MNYLEQLISEWYRYQGYFVKENILLGKIIKGNRREIDILALNIKEDHFIHIEISADFRRKNKNREYARKFAIDRKFYRKIYEGYKLPQVINKEFIFMELKRRTKDIHKDIKVRGIAYYLKEIEKELKEKRLEDNRVLEGLPLIKTLQLFIHKQKADATS